MGIYAKVIYITYRYNIYIIYGVIKMKTHIQGYGDSLYLRIPSGIVKKYDVKDKTDIDVHESLWDKIFE